MNEVEQNLKAVERAIMTVEAAQSPIPGADAEKWQAPTEQRERAAWVTLANQAADGMVAAAENAVTEAKNALEAAKRHADALRAEVDKRERDIDDLSNRIKALGGEILSAHRKFHKDSE